MVFTNKNEHQSHDNLEDTLAKKFACHIQTYAIHGDAKRGCESLPNAIPSPTLDMHRV